MSAVCLFCHAALPTEDIDPCRDVDGRPMTWCDSTCSSAWRAQDPERSKGWVSLEDLGPAAMKKIFHDSGLEIYLPDEGPN